MAGQVHSAHQSLVILVTPVNILELVNIWEPVKSLEPVNIWEPVIILEPGVFWNLGIVWLLGSIAVMSLFRFCLLAVLSSLARRAEEEEK